MVKFHILKSTISIRHLLSGKGNRIYFFDLVPLDSRSKRNLMVRILDRSHLRTIWSRYLLHDTRELRVKLAFTLCKEAWFFFFFFFFFLFSFNFFMSHTLETWVITSLLSFVSSFFSCHFLDPWVKVYYLHPFLPLRIMPCCYSVLHFVSISFMCVFLSISSSFVS